MFNAWCSLELLFYQLTAAQNCKGPAGGLIPCHEIQMVHYILLWIFRCLCLEKLYLVHLESFNKVIAFGSKYVII